MCEGSSGSSAWLKRWLGHQDTTTRPHTTKWTFGRLVEKWVLIRHVVQMCLFGTLFIMWGGNHSMLAIKCAFIETTTFMLQSRYHDAPFRSIQSNPIQSNPIQQPPFRPDVLIRHVVHLVCQYLRFWQSNARL